MRKINRILKKTGVIILAAAMLAGQTGFTALAEEIAEVAVTEDKAVGNEVGSPDDPSDGDESFENTVSSDNADTEKESVSEDSAERKRFEESGTLGGVTITVEAEEGVFPEDAVLSVKEAGRSQEKQAEEAVEEERPEDQNVAASYTYDIKVLDKEGNELQPADEAQVKVSFTLDEVADSNLMTNIYHIREADPDGTASEENSGKTGSDPEEIDSVESDTESVEGDSKASENTELVAEKLSVETDGDTATAETDGFSLYTVEFTYNDLQYVMPGDSEIPLSEILDAVGLTGDVNDVKVSDSSLFSAARLKVSDDGKKPAKDWDGNPIADDNGVWFVTAHKAFSTEEWMKVTINDVVYEITVTDDNPSSNSDFTVRYFLGDKEYIVDGGSSAYASDIIRELNLGINPAKVFTATAATDKIVCQSIDRGDNRDWTITATEYFDGEKNGIFQLQFDYSEDNNKFKQFYAACYKEITTWEELQHDLKKGGEIKLTCDLTAANTDSMLAVPNDPIITSTTLDLNGHTLDGRALSESDNFKTVLKVENNLTIKDSGTGGQIIGSGKLVFEYEEGNKVYDGNVVDVLGAHLSLNGGTISGTDGYEVIYVNGDTARFDFNGGTITGTNENNIIDFAGISASMTGGTISGSDLKESAVRVGGNVTMSNVTVSASGEKYGGVYVPAGDGNELHLSGSPVITGGIYLEAGEVIHIDDALDEAVSIPVRAQTKPSVNRSVTITSGFSGKGSLSNFTNTVSSASLAVNESGELELCKDQASEWDSLQNLINEAAENSGTVTLNKNYTADEYDVHLEIPSGKTVTLDLNGYTVDGSALDEEAVIEIGGEPFWNGAIVVEGELVLKGTNGGSLVNTGKLWPLSVVGSFTIEGGTISGTVATGEGSSIRMDGGTLENRADCAFEVKGEFVMNGGTISGHDARYVVTVGAPFTMNNGTITGTNISKSIVSLSGRFTMNGGRISGAGASGGVSCHFPLSFHVSGAPVIDGGIYPYDISEGKGSINVDAPLTSGASFSVITSDAASAKGAVVANPVGEYTLTASDAEKFHSALDETLVGVLDNGSVRLKKPLSENMITLSAASGTYSGETLTPPTLMVKDGEETLTKDTHYTVSSWSGDFINAGEYTATVSGTGDYYTGSVTATFTVNPKPVTAPTIELTGDLTYTGSEVKPDVTAVKDGDTVIPSGEYEVGYSGNINAGTNTATVTITDKAGGNYTVSGSRNFSITPKAITVSADNKTKTYDNNASTDPALTATVTGAVAGDTINYSLSRAAGQNVGNYDITVTPGSNPNYTVNVESGRFSIEKADYPANRPQENIETANANDKVSKVALPSGWQWSDADKDRDLNESEPVTVSANYIAADKDNYIEGGLVRNVTITRKAYVHVNKVTLNKTTASIVKGKTLALKAAITPADATNKAVTWSSSNTAVAKVFSTGVVTAVNGGTAKITVKTKDGSKTAVCTVTVSIPVTGVKLNKSSASIVKGKTLALTATVAPSNATNKGVTWSSSNTKVATVSTKGVVKAVDGGSAVITVTTADGKKTAKCTVKVIVPVTGIKLNKTKANVARGYTMTLTPTITPSNATNKAVTWKSSNTKIATVTSKGVVKGIKNGTVNITVTTNDGKKTATCKVTVVNPTPVKSVKLNKTKASVVKGYTITLTPTVSPSNATNKAVTWKSSNTKIAMVTSAGVVKGVKAGTANITVTTKDGKKTAVCAVTVTNPIAVKSVKLNAAKVTVAKGKTYTLKATINPTNATNKAVTWKSSNTKIATVTSKGVVKGIAKGSAKITVTTTDGKKTAVCTVTVK